MRGAIVDVVVRWHDDVIAIERFDPRALDTRSIDVGPVRIDAAHLALPCTITRGAHVVSLTRSERAPRARVDHEIDPVLVRAAGVPLVLMAGLFAALVVTAPRIDDMLFSFELGANTGMRSVSVSSVRFADQGVAQPRARSSRHHDMFRSITPPSAERTPDENASVFAELMNAVGDVSAASTSTSRLFAQMDDATRAALFAGGARSGGDIGTPGFAALGLGTTSATGASSLPVGSIGMASDRRRARIDTSDHAVGNLLFGPGERGCDLAAQIRAIDTGALRPSSASAAAAVEAPQPRGVADYLGFECWGLLKLQKAEGDADGEPLTSTAPTPSTTTSTTRRAPVEDNESCDLAPAIRDAMRARMPAIRTCALRWPDAAIGSRLVLQWSVAKDGAFVDVHADGVEPRALASCLAKALDGTRIAKGCEGSEVTVTYPMMFDPSG